MDSFANYRNSIGLPALSVNWGAWSLGMWVRQVLKRSNTTALFRRSSGTKMNLSDSLRREKAQVDYEALPANDCFFALELLLRSDSVNPQISIAALNWGVMESKFANTPMESFIRHCLQKTPKSTTLSVPKAIADPQAAFTSASLTEQLLKLFHESLQNYDLRYISQNLQ
jgi:hypothetical protein